MDPRIERDFLQENPIAHSTRKIKIFTDKDSTKFDLVNEKLSIKSN